MPDANDIGRIRDIEMSTIDRCIPLNALLELTYRCNLRCRHCYVTPDYRREMSTSRVFDALEQLAAAGTLYLTLSGGEPMLRSDLWAIIHRARALHHAVRVFTNGTLIGDDEAARFASAGVLDVSVSLHGADAETHERVTGVAGSFAKAIRGLSLLADAGVSTRVKSVIMSHNAHQRNAIDALATGLGATAQFDPQLTPRNDGDRTPLAMLASEEAIAAAFEGDGPHHSADPYEALPCGAGRSIVSISPSGEVYPCVQLPMLLGDLRDRPFSEIWSSQKAVELRALRVGGIERCPTCEDLPYCRTCLGLNLIENGDIRRPAATSCRTARIRRSVSTGDRARVAEGVVTV